MRNLLAIAVVVCFLPACASFKATRKYHTPPIKPPSVTPVKESIGRASVASLETSRQIGAIRAGTDRVDYKAGRALEFFLDPK